MLLRQDGRRHEYRNLLSVGNRFKRRTDRDLGLSEADIAADQAVHDLRAFHVTLCIFDRVKLVLGFFIRKQFLKLTLPYRIRTVGVSRTFLPDRVKIDQVLRDILYRA